MIVTYPLAEYSDNLKYKFIEGAFVRTVNVSDEL